MSESQIVTEGINLFLAMWRCSMRTIAAGAVLISSLFFSSLAAQANPLAYDPRSWFPKSLPRPSFVARMVEMRETDIKILLKTKST